MALTEIRNKLKAAIWQAVAQSGVDVSALPQDQMDKLVAAISENVIKEFNDILQDAPQTPAKIGETWREDDEDDEEILWEGRPFLSMSVFYQITSERIRIIEGLLGKERHDIELVRVQDIDHKQNLTERALNIGDVFIRSHDVKDPEVALNNISKPAEVHEIIRRAMLKARRKYNVSFREEM